MLRRQTAASRVRERGTATHSAAGVIPAPTRTTGGGILRRRRSAGRATPVATRTQAVARMPLVARKGGEYMRCPALPPVRTAGRARRVRTPATDPGAPGQAGGSSEPL